MPLTHERTFRVRYYECDPYGHLNNSNYLRYMQETAFDASAAAGYDLARYQAMERIWWIRSSEIEYLAPVRYNERVTVKTWVENFQRSHSPPRLRILPSETLANSSPGPPPTGPSWTLKAGAQQIFRPS